MNGHSPATSRRAHKIETHVWSASIYNPVQIHLQYLPDVVTIGPGVESPAFRTEESRKLALPVPLPGLQHIARASLEERQGLEVVQQNCQHQKGFCTSRRRTLAKVTPSCSSRTCPYGVMSKSGRGSQENHGKNVKQKAGLNEETLRNSLPSGRGEYQEMAETPAVLLNESPGSPPPADSSRRYTRILLIVFLCRWRRHRLLRVRARCAHRAQPRFHSGLSIRECQFSRSARGESGLIPDLPEDISFRGIGAFGTG